MTAFVLVVLTLGVTVFSASAAAKLRGRSAYRDYRAGLTSARLL